MSKYIFLLKCLLILELLIASLRGISEVILSFSMGGITNAAVDHNTNQLFLSSLIYMSSLLAIYLKLQQNTPTSTGGEMNAGVLDKMILRICSICYIGE